ncbi:putative leucine-rich repeat-containing protein DDB_G0290503 [Argopecten irradians]|uniref:putative leucine-rich repeat-containing protein DDB_G0290503 n=1 Tax=Argopecten irradians TaxID=31199 RepID=UPI003721FBF7
MDEKEKDIIDRNSELLVRNIVLTPEFYDLLQTYNVLPVTMVTDIKARKSRDDRNRRLLKTIKLRGCDSYRKLRHVLSLTGHAFLADHLHEEETDTKLLRSEDFFGKFPTIFNHVSDDIKTKLIQYLETKLKEKMLVNAWVNSALERSEILESRKLEFEHERELRTKLEKCKRQLSRAADDLASAKEELRQNRLEMRVQMKEVEESEKKFKHELGVQSRFNAANNNSVLRLTEQFSAVNTKIRQLNGLVQTFLRINVASESEEDMVPGAMLKSLESNIRLMMDKVDQNAETLNRSSSERSDILSMLKKPLTKTEPLSEIMRKHVEKENKIKLSICRELEKMAESLRDGTGNTGSVTSTTDLRLMRNMIATFRVEAEHIRKKLNWKDTQISELVEELKQKPPSLRRIEDCRHQATSEVFSKGQLSTMSSSGSKDNEASIDVKVADPLKDKDMPTLHSKTENWSRESSPLKPISIVTDSSEDNDIGDENKHRLVSFAQNSSNTEVKRPNFTNVNGHVNKSFSSPRTPQSSVIDGDSIAIQEVTSYMEKKMTEGKLPPIAH